MPEMRRDPVTGLHIILAPERASRPDQAEGLKGSCVFCPGREAETPPEVLRLPGPGGWRARVVPNKYPAIDAASGGVHEVVIESARHVASFVLLSDAEIADVLWLWRDRVRVWGASGRWPGVLVFKNEGPAAGASIEHVHSQVLAMTGAHATTRQSMFGEACPLCADAGPDRAVAQRGGFVARVPYAPRFPHEVRLSPAEHRARFEEEGDGGLLDLAGLLRDVLQRLSRMLGPFPYNLVLQTSPYRPAANFHWYLEILPRTSRPGGFEWGSGTFINIASPEDSARRLREARP